MAGKLSQRQCCDRFLKEWTLLQDWGQRMFDATQDLSIRDKQWIFEAVAVSLLTAWDQFVAELFYRRVSSDSSALAKTRQVPLPKKLTVAMAEALLAGDRYFDVRDSDELISKAKKYMGLQHPFGSIAKTDRTRIDELIAIRNYIVHNSRFAKARYIEKVLKPAGIQNVLTPGRFLLTTSRYATRLDTYFVAVQNAANSVRQAI
jgi:hypothetical protein